MKHMVRSLVSWVSTWPAILTNRTLVQKAIRFLLRYADDGPVRSVYGVTLQYSPQGVFASGLRRMAISGGYETEYLQLFSAYATDTVVDVGAHEGFVSLYLARFAKRVIACEPNPDNLRLLDENVRLNTHLPVTVAACAVGDRDGTTVLHCSPDGGAWGSLVNFEHEHYQRAISVKMQTVDSLTRDTGRSSLLKVDAEGYELQVLRGAQDMIRRDRPVIVFEVSLTFWALLPGSVQELLDFVKAPGYDLYELDERGKLRPLPRWLHRRVDNLFALPR